MKKRTEISRENDFVSYTVEGDETRYLTSVDEWDLYEIKFKLIEETDASIEELEKMCDLVRTITLNEVSQDCEEY